jgi:hypothetical protein
MQAGEENQAGVGSYRVHAGPAMADQEPEEPPIYPALETWLAGAPAGKIWSEMLAGKHGGSDVLLGPMETIVQRLREQPPARLPPSGRPSATISS